jgi:MYXO-CTERM domain-containing protein
MARLLRTLLGPLLGLCVSASAEAQVLRFSTTAPGKIVGTGNTLGLSKGLNENGPGLKDSIGTFISLGNTVDDTPVDVANPWPLHTTYDWTKDGSTAVLDIPHGVDVLYAELVWGGSYNYGGEDVTASLGSPVTLVAGGTSMAIAPDPATALTIAQQSMKGFFVNYYMRSADVTAFVKAQTSGAYSVSGVPATQSETINSLNAAGWTLAVVVRDSSLPIRNLSVFVGGSFVDENSQQDYTVSGFCTPPAGVVAGRALVSAIEGDANLVGDQLLIAPTAAGPFVGLSGPNNPADNFFCSQINDEKGLLDTQGSFGTMNPDPVAGTNIPGGRQGWDVTTVSLSSMAGQLQNGQTSAVLRTITTGDSYVPALAALQIDVNAPDFTGAGSKLATSVDTVSLGDKLKVTLDLDNTGQVQANVVKLSLPLEAGLSLASFTMDGQSGDINGKPVTGAALGAGVDAGTLAAGGHRTVSLDLDVVGPPQGAKYALGVTWSYSYQVCVGGAMLSESFSQFGQVAFNGPTSGTGASTGAGGASGSGGAGGGSMSGTSGSGDSGGNASAGGGGSTSGGATTGEKSGCGCAVPGGDDRPSAPSIVGLALAAAWARARRRRG